MSADRPHSPFSEWAAQRAEMAVLIASSAIASLRASVFINATSSAFNASLTFISYQLPSYDRATSTTTSTS